MGRGFPCTGNANIQCNDCNKAFKTLDCYEEHLRLACKIYKQCPKCGDFWKPRDVDDVEHECGAKKCGKCHAKHSGECFIVKPKLNKDRVYRIVAFDFECKVNKKGQDGKTPHEPNYLAAHITCTKCIDAGCWKDVSKKDCKVCGPEKLKVWPEWAQTERITMEFLEWLLRDLPNKYETLAYAHNGARYDNHFVLQELYNRGPAFLKLTTTGNKVYEVRQQKTKNTNTLILRDSLLLFGPGSKLATLPKTFNLSVKPKPFFPYRANHEGNYVPGDFPPPSDFCPDSMTKAERGEFMTWYDKTRAEYERTGRKYNLKQELYDYCVNDSEILLHALVEFRNLFNGLAGFDIFYQSCTFTGGCLRLFKQKFMKENSMAIFPPTGYGLAQRQSTKGMKYVKWFAQAHNVHVQHRDNGGEKRFGAYFVDGFIKAEERHKSDFVLCGVPTCRYCNEAPTQDVALEFNGCYFHGCDETGCLPQDGAGVGGQSLDELWQRTMRREKELREQHGLFVFRKQECAFNKEFKNNVDVQKFFEKTLDTGPINLRDAFFGGRVHPTKMYYKPKDDEEIKYFDVCSLYPYVLCKPYPVGHPKEVLRDARMNEWEWDHPSDYNYRGIIKCVVVPPPSLLVPVLPMRDAGRLVFPLCRQCTIDSRHKNPHGLKQCTHSDKQRSFTTTTTHVELDQALLMGYKVRGVIEVWHWDQWDSEIFSSYIKTFYKVKQEASGWDECESDEEKDERIRQIHKKTGVLLEKEKVEDNPGLAKVAKNCLNSLWGRFAMHTDRNQVEVVCKPERLTELFGDPSIVVNSIIKLNDDLIRVSYGYKEQFEPTDPNANLVIAIFTTAYGRTELFNHMRAVEETMGGAVGASLLYNDTDSVIFKQKKNNPAIVPGFCLGEMEDEHPKSVIEEYSSGGCKQYCLRLRSQKDGKPTIVTVQKLRGITLKGRAQELLSYEKQRDMVLSKGKDDVLLVPTTVWCNDERSNVFTREIFKRYIVL
ncbi:hypothetical protein AAVH_24561 [Aphelenchoides avenae]|nr:hypothetical protein AAVH_24561 [Aphelenchus avenae]